MDEAHAVASEPTGVPRSPPATGWAVPVSHNSQQELLLWMHNMWIGLLHQKMMEEANAQQGRAAEGAPAKKRRKRGRGRRSAQE